MTEKAAMIFCDMLAICELLCFGEVVWRARLAIIHLREILWRLLKERE